MNRDMILLIITAICIVIAASGYMHRRDHYKQLELSATFQTAPRTFDGVVEKK